MVDGDATLKYYMSGNTADADSQYAYDKDDVPATHRHQLLWDTFNTDVESAQVQVEDVTYQELTFYQYNDASNVPTPVPTYTDGDVDTLIDDMEDAGWYLSAGDANTNKGTNTDLRTAIVSFEYIGATDTSTVNVKVLPEDDIRYSTDGVTFTEDPPADPDDITHLEITIGGESVDFLIKPETELVNPVERIINEAIPPYDANYSSYTGGTYSLGISNADITRLFGFQFRSWRGKAWGNNEELWGGISPVFPIDEIKLTPPHLIGQDAFDDHDDKIEGNDGYYRIISDKSGVKLGELDVLQVRDDDLADYGSSDYVAFLCCFESYPNSELHDAASATGTYFSVLGTNRGLSTGGHCVY